MPTATAKKSATQKAAAKKASAKKTVAKKAAGQARTPKMQDATALLRADHRHVSDLFAQFESARAASKKEKLVAEICKQLSVHAQIEEEIFYPAVKKALKDKILVPEATVEHASMKALIAQIEGAPADGEMYDAKVRVLSEYVKHHVKEEERDMFPKARATALDMHALGEQLAQRKQALLQG